MRKQFVAALTLLVATAADACTTAIDLDPERPIVAYNYDFPIGQGLVLINKRGVGKASGAGAGAATWRSRYGSVTFVQFGRDNPMTGMNEAGLVVSQMWLDAARYEEPDGRPPIGVLEWMQYLLDTAATVEEALDRAGEVRVQSSVPLHYALVARDGRATVVEFLGGVRVVHRGDALPHAALANSTYADSLSYLASLDGSAAPDGTASLARFARAAIGIKSPAPSDPVERAFETLRAVEQPGQTRWSVVHDPRNLVVRWRSNLNGMIRSADLASFDLSCGTPVQVLDVHAGGGEVGRLFVDYTSAANEALVLSSYAQTSFLAPLGREAALAAARLPEESRCTE